LIKSGGMGSVYIATDRRFETKCAVKEMLPQSSNPHEEQYMIDSFRREAKILNRLRHPNIPIVTDYFIESDRYYLVMDYIEGKDLDTVMSSCPGGIIPEYTVIEITKEILNALHYLHSQDPPVIYRDLKPGNIMVRDSDGKVILIDFGIARTIEPHSDTPKTCIGTPAFSPRESFDGKAEIRTDIYCLGATMHCLLTGIVPSIPFDFKPVRFHNPDISERLEKIVMKALSIDKIDRYANAYEMKSALLSSSAEISVRQFIEPEMVYITGGTFIMGSDKWIKEEKPFHGVSVGSFHAGKYTVTNKEYCLYNPCHDNPGDRFPAVNVSWNDAVEYCRWLSRMSGKNYRLPTEAEWEYACRAGTGTDYYWGNEINGDYCWYDGNSGHKIHQTGEKKPNQWGLYDMSGNVWEWCSDWYDNNYYCVSPLTDPQGPHRGTRKVKRGGGWDYDAHRCRSAGRSGSNPDYRNNCLGFRLVRTL
ncbi:MAG: bifunctional serine/threonine-protein kinase/formylglycine-generating enzyme family protein, partial [Candidatus Eremiobacterota bacterium]